jgi:hypothetical protein
MSWAIPQESTEEDVTPGGKLILLDVCPIKTKMNDSTKLSSFISVTTKRNERKPSNSIEHHDHQIEQASPDPDEFVCPLTSEVMREPVMTRWGHNFERSALLEWIGRGNHMCPLTRNPMSLIKDVIVNRSLKARIDEWRRRPTSQEDFQQVTDNNDWDHKVADLYVNVKSEKALRRVLESSNNPKGREILERQKMSKKPDKKKRRWLKRSPAA